MNKKLYHSILTIESKLQVSFPKGLLHCLLKVFAVTITAKQFTYKYG